jgi:hypothetical protein
MQTVRVVALISVIGVALAGQMLFVPARAQYFDCGDTAAQSKERLNKELKAINDDYTQRKITVRDEFARQRDAEVARVKREFEAKMSELAEQKASLKDKQPEKFFSIIPIRMEEFQTQADARHRKYKAIGDWNAKIHESQNALEKEKIATSKRLTEAASRCRY